MVVGADVARRAPCATQHRTWPDTYVARLEALALMQTLNADLLASRSATKTLEHWCAVHAMAPQPKIVAVRVPGVDKPAADAQRQRLQVGPADEIKYRRVRLMCGDHVLSEADNWYVPSRLTPPMNHDLETTDIPFGKVRGIPPADTADLCGRGSCGGCFRRVGKITPPSPRGSSGATARDPARAVRAPVPCSSMPSDGRSPKSTNIIRARSWTSRCRAEPPQMSC